MKEVFAKLVEKIAKLIDVKSIVTLSLTGVFCVLCRKGVMPQEFLSVYMLVLGFYFNAQASKKKDNGTAE